MEECFLAQTKVSSLRLPKLDYVKGMEVAVRKGGGSLRTAHARRARPGGLDHLRGRNRGGAGDTDGVVERR
jgi:hypothetical protein